MPKRIDFNLYLITDRKQVKTGNLTDAVEKALQGGVRAVQLREKDLSSRELYELAVELRRITSRFKAKLFINDRLDIALAVDADGVHLAENSIPADQARKLLSPEKLIGVSCHNLQGAVAAEKNGADLITFGPIFQTPSKAIYGEPVGLEKLAAAASALSIPVFGLGGIKADNISSVLTAGAFGIALISDIIAADNPMQSTSRIIDILSTIRSYSDENSQTHHR
jgi:thiamine-phosphate pyrophosphorylase